MFIVLLVIIASILAACGDKDGLDSDSNEEQSNIDAVENGVPMARVTTSRAAIYVNPDRDAPIVQSLVEGDTLSITAQTPPDALGSIFYSVQIGDQFGWVLSSQVETSGDVASLPVVPAINAVPTVDIFEQTLDATPGVLIRITEPDTPLYSGPSVENEILRTIEVDVELDISFQTPPNELGVIYYGVEVPIDGHLRLGWIPSTNGEILGDISTVQLIVISTPTTESESAATAVVQDIPTTIVDNPTITTIPDSENPTIEQTAEPSPTQPIESANTTPIPPTLTLEPTISPTPLPSLSPTPLIREVDTPIQINLPDTWESGHFEISTVSSIPGGDTEITISKYEGLLPNGANGYIWVFSGFSNLVPLSQSFDLYPDANLILRSLLFVDCQIGLDIEERTTYQIGEHEGIGGALCCCWL